MLASSAPSARTGSAHQGLTKFSNCTGNEHYVSLLLIAPNLKKKDIKTCFNCSIKRGSTLVLIPEHNLIPNESELAQIAANVFLFFTVLIYLLAIVRLVGPFQLQACSIGLV